jgi:hypothetical protein
MLPNVMSGPRFHEVRAGLAHDGQGHVGGTRGGEEFTVLLPRTDDVGAYGIAGRLRAPEDADEATDGCP